VADSRTDIPVETRSQKIDLARTIAPPISISGKNQSETRTLADYAEFWKVPCHVGRSHKQNEILVSSESISRNEAFDCASVIIFPAGPEESQKIADEYNFGLTTRETIIRLPIAPDASVSIRTRVTVFSGTEIERVIASGETPVLFRLRGTPLWISAVDLVSDFDRLVFGGLEEVPSRRFRFISRLPFSYRAVPSFIRNRAFKTSRSGVEMTEDKLSPVECLRVIFLASLVASTGAPIPRIAFWRKAKSNALVVTHDVETQTGLEDGAARIADVESKLGIRATWNIPSERYPLSSQLLIALASAEEVGGHDTKHDGRLILEKLEDKVERVGRCKTRLESLSKKRIEGFRAPLLQHGRELLLALGKTGYQYDSSAPTWEPLSPTSLRPHGVGTIFPFSVSGVLEIPVSIPQDHQLIRVGGLSTSEAVQEILRVSKLVRAIGGPCVLLIHPDYEFGQPENAEAYYRLLELLKSAPGCETMTLGELTRWWTYRADANIETINGQTRIQSPQVGDRPGDLQLELVTGYGPDGFKITIFDQPQIAALVGDGARE
jgi:peptidoglycan/xylan/chitin deacetylase (PgdA/CDA1 family)